jgi:hypothetical protein
VTHLTHGGDEDDLDELGDTVEDDLGVPMTEVCSQMLLSDGRIATVTKVYTKEGELGFWAVKMPPPPPGELPQDIPRQLENLVDRLMPGRWRKGRCARDCLPSLPPRAGRTPPIRLTLGPQLLSFPLQEY